MRKGFTLLELIIVIIVIGILVAMALPQFTRVAERGRVAKAKAALDMIRKAEGIFYAVNSTYVSNLGAGGLADEVPETAQLGSDTEWTYGVVSTVNTFTATATRVGGPNPGATVTINEQGTIGGTHPLI